MQEQNSILPLLPKSALEYFNDIEDSNKLYLKATSIRTCLENIVDTIFIHIINDDTNIDTKKWGKQDLYEKLKSLDVFFSKNKQRQLHDIRKIGNKGTHPKLHKMLEEQDIKISLNDLSKLCEWTILSYFQKYGFKINTWLPTIFSTLQPIYRIRILEPYFHSLKFENKEFVNHLEKIQYNTDNLIFNKIEDVTDREKELDEIILIIDKLSMAYLKNKEYEKSIKFINTCFNKNKINERFKNEMLEKLDILWKSIDHLPISQSIEETKNRFTEIMKVVKEEEESLFITIFTAIISQE
jgi:hypothetical protein